MSVERGPARWGAVAVIPGRVVAGGQLVKLHPNCRIATLISRDKVATSAEGMYGSLRHLVKPILEKISVATRTWTASLKPTNSSLVPTSLKTWYPRSLLLTARVITLHAPSLHVVPSPVEEAIRIIPLFRLIEIESAQPALLVSENDIWTALSGIATTSMLSR